MAKEKIIKTSFLGKPPDAKKNAPPGKKHTASKPPVHTPKPKTHVHTPTHTPSTKAPDPARRTNRIETPEEKEYWENIKLVAKTIRQYGISKVVLHGNPVYDIPKNKDFLEKWGKGTGPGGAYEIKVPDEFRTKSPPSFINNDKDTTDALMMLNTWAEFTPAIFQENIQYEVVPKSTNLKTYEPMQTKKFLEDGKGGWKETEIKPEKEVTFWVDVGNHNVSVEIAGKKIELFKELLTNKSSRKVDAFADHHGEGRGYNTSATQVVFDIGKFLQLPLVEGFDPDDEKKVEEQALKKKEFYEIAKFNTDYDDLNYLDEKINPLKADSKNIVNEEFLKKDYVYSLYSLAKFLPGDIANKIVTGDKEYLRADGKLRDLFYTFSKEEIEKVEKVGLLNILNNTNASFRNFTKEKEILAKYEKDLEAIKNSPAKKEEEEELENKTMEELTKYSHWNFKSMDKVSDGTSISKVPKGEIVTSTDHLYEMLKEGDEVEWLYDGKMIKGEVRLGKNNEKEIVKLGIGDIKISYAERATDDPVIIPLRKLVNINQTKIEYCIRNEKKLTRYAKENGINEESPILGKTKYRNFDAEFAYVEDNIAYLTARGLGYDSFASYNPQNGYIFINSDGRHDLMPIWEEINKIIPGYPKPTRGKMMHPPKDDLEMLEKVKKLIPEKKFLEILGMVGKDYKEPTKTVVASIEPDEDVAELSETEKKALEAKKETEALNAKVADFDSQIAKLKEEMESLIIKSYPIEEVKSDVKEIIKNIFENSKLKEKKPEFIKYNLVKIKDGFQIRSEIKLSNMGFWIPEVKLIFDIPLINKDGELSLGKEYVMTDPIESFYKVKQDVMALLPEIIPKLKTLYESKEGEEVSSLRIKDDMLEVR